jgi:predicted nicotinamide N-methyase
MSPSPTPAEVLSTSAGDFPPHDCRLRHGGREGTVLHTGAVVTREDEACLLNRRVDRLPYGVALWPAALALAHEVAGRADDFRGRVVLELGAGTGLPGVVAATLGDRVVQTDRDELALALCRRNGARNGAGSVAYRLADWTGWDDAGRYDWVLGSDVLYGAARHPHLRRVFESNLAPGSRVLLADPFWGVSLGLVVALGGAGWGVSLTR